MERLHTRIGEHLIHIVNVPDNLMNLFQRHYPTLPETDDEPHIVIHIEDGYGVPFVDYDVSIMKETNRISFRRADYLIETDPEYRHANIYVNDELALKHALMNLYSSHIVYHNWGLIIHSSCVIDGGKAHMFAGHSGAGKSTAARLSYPRKLLSDEATVIKITPHEITVFNSPFRSEQEVTDPEGCYPLASIHILVQALHNKRAQVMKSNGLLQLIDKVFYWTHSREETGRTLTLVQTLARHVPVYELHFQKDNSFWELIS